MRGTDKGDIKLAKKRKTNTRNKAAVLQEDPRVNMYEGKDRVLKTEDDEIEAKTKIISKNVKKTEDKKKTLTSKKK